jgi:hypothetical protein
MLKPVSVLRATFLPVTARFFSCAVPTELRARPPAATAVPLSATNNAT